MHEREHGNTKTFEVMKKGIWTKIMAILSEEEKMMEITTTEGVTLVADEMVEGAAIQVMDAEGGLVPAPAGEYEAEDGTKIVVEEEGVIGAVVAPAPPNPDDEDEALQAKIEQAVQAAIEPLQNEITDLQGQLDAKNAENLSLMKGKEKAEEKLSKIRGLGVKFTKEDFVDDEDKNAPVTRAAYRKALAEFNAQRGSMTPARRIAMNLKMQEMEKRVQD